MNAKQLAELLNGRQYLNEITDKEAQAAKSAGLVVVFGLSDDITVMKGAINDSFGCFNGGYIYISPNGVVKNRCDCERCPYFFEQQARWNRLTAVWDIGGFSWQYQTDLPHETFIIMEDDETYCRGIVFSLPKRIY